MDNNLICGNCHSIFDIHELKIETEIMYGIEFKEKVCPVCGSKGYTKISEEQRYEKYLKNINQII